MLSISVRQVLEDVRHHLTVTDGMRATTNDTVMAEAKSSQGHEELTSVLRLSDYIGRIDAALQQSSELSPGVSGLLGRLKAYLATIDGMTAIEADVIDEEANAGAYSVLNHREYLDAIDKVSALQSAVFLFPAIQRLLCHAVSPHEVGYFRADIPLVQHRDDLFVRKPTLLHSPLGGGLTLSLDQVSGVTSPSL